MSLRTAMRLLGAAALVAAIGACIRPEAVSVGHKPLTTFRPTAPAEYAHSLSISGGYSDSIDAAHNFVIEFKVISLADTPLRLSMAAPPAIPGFDGVTAVMLPLSAWSDGPHAATALPRHNTVEILSRGGTAMIAISGHVRCPTAGGSAGTLSISVNGMVVDFDGPLVASDRSWTEQVAADACA